RHGLPAAERALVLALPLRRDRADALVLLVGRLRAGGLDVLRAALGADAGERRGPLDPRPPHPHDLVRGRGDQLPPHDPQHAHRGDDVDALAPLRLVDRGHGLAADRGAADALRGPDDAAARPTGGDTLLRPERRRQRAPLAARLLVLRPPRG